MEKYFVLEGRSTSKGAYTTMNGERFEFSKSGTHWMERKPVNVGDKIYITDISNSGKHYCRIIRITEIDPEVKYEIVEQADEHTDICPVCDRKEV